MMFLCVAYLCNDKTHLHNSHTFRNKCIAGTGKIDISIEFCGGIPITCEQT